MKKILTLLAVATILFTGLFAVQFSGHLLNVPTAHACGNIAEMSSGEDTATFAENGIWIKYYVDSTIYWDTCDNKVWNQSWVYCYSGGSLYCGGAIIHSCVSHTNTPWQCVSGVAYKYYPNQGNVNVYVNSPETTIPRDCATPYGDIIANQIPGSPLVYFYGYSGFC